MANSINAYYAHVTGPNILKASSDKDFHDFAGAAIDGFHTRIPEHMGDTKIIDVPITAVKL